MSVLPSIREVEQPCSCRVLGMVWNKGKVYCHCFSTLL